MVASTAADQYTKISARVLDHRKFWDALHAVDGVDAAGDLRNLNVRGMRLDRVKGHLDLLLLGVLDGARVTVTRDRDAS